MPNYKKDIMVLNSMAAHNQSNFFPQDILTAVCDARELFVRATPMKPTYEEHDYMTYDNGDNIDNQPSMTIQVYKCPSCKQTVGSQFNYCDNCGQCLDWSDK